MLFWLIMTGSKSHTYVHLLAFSSSLHSALGPGPIIIMPPEQPSQGKKKDIIFAVALTLPRPNRMHPNASSIKSVDGVSVSVL